MKKTTQARVSGTLDAIVDGLTPGCAWVHRRQRSTWVFRPNPRYNAFSHTTRKGTTYLIIQGLELGKPFWIGQVRKDAVFTMERALRAREIEFENGGRYIFPNAEVDRQEEATQ